jgi:hypothetical protein
MSGCLTKVAIVDKLAQIENWYVQFLAGGIDSATLQANVGSLIASSEDDEYQGGNYSSRIVSVVPDPTSPTITLNLLYVAAVPGVVPVECSTKECFAVSITFLPHPNGLQALALTPDTDILYKDGRVTGGYDLCSAITAYNHTKEKKDDGVTTECLVICGGEIGSCEPKDCLDFLSFLCNKLEVDFSIRRDKCGRLWLVTLDWNVEDFPYDHKECETVEMVETCVYYVDYEKLRHYYEKKSCFRFDECDPAELAQKTKCYEILFLCVGGTLTAAYSTDDYKKLPQFFREIVECCEFECVDIATAEPIVKKSSGDFEQICFGNYNCVRKLYCCKRDKCEKHRKYHECCRKHAHERHHHKHCKTACKCGYVKKYGEAGECSSSESEQEPDDEVGHGDDNDEVGHGDDNDEVGHGDACADVGYSDGGYSRNEHSEDDDTYEGRSGYDFICPHKKDKCCYYNEHHGEKSCRDNCCYGAAHYRK